MAYVESTITEEFLTCSICFEIFKDPKTLPCLHSFCKDCIDKLTDEGRTNEHQCPICREKFQLPKNGAKDLKTNFCLKNLIEFVTSTKDVKKSCSFCSLKGETVDATSRCLACNDLLCPECAEHRHMSTTLTLHHQVVSLAEVNAGKYHDEIRSKQQIPCSEHKGEDLRFFCETCDVLVCRDCIVLSHRNHKCVTPSDARKQMEENLKLLLNSLDKKLQTMKNARENVVTSLNKLKDEQKVMQENLEKEVSSIIKKIMDSKIAAEEKFDQFVKSKQDILQKQKETIQDEMQILEETSLFCGNILQCGSDIEILSMKTEMRDRLANLQSFNTTKICIVEDVIPPVIQFCHEENCFKMLGAINEKEPKNTPEAKQEANGKNPLESKTSKLQERMTNVLPPERVSERIAALDKDGPKSPNYTSVAWVNEDTIAVADLRNQKLKRISWKGNVESVDVAICMVVSSFKDGLACKTEGNTLHIFNAALQLRKTISEVTTLLTCSQKSSEVCWISGLKKIFVLKDDQLKEITIHDQHSTSNLSKPMFGHVLNNGMFVISDWDKNCVFLIKRSGYIETRKYCDTISLPGSISSNSDLNIFVCGFHESKVIVFDKGGRTLYTINLHTSAPNPRSIAINPGGHTLVANGKSIIQIN